MNQLTPRQLVKMSQRVGGDVRLLCAHINDFFSLQLVPAEVLTEGGHCLEAYEAYVKSLETEVQEES